ncbi:MAG: hypothetical protein JRN09_00150 [Nitrososphaerota archaeon]|nr:hypothetical protein [Nitrososphaerota archaeon]
MVTDERYAEEWHGLFPRFVLAGLVFAFVGILLQLLVDALIPLPVPIPSSGAILRFEVQGVVSVAFFPFAVFGLFYLSSRVRVNLWKDFFPVAASIFLGALVAFLVFGLPEAIQANPGNGPVYAILQSTASAVYGSISYAFVGFVAVLVSYRRRL